MCPTPRPCPPCRWPRWTTTPRRHCILDPATVWVDLDGDGRSRPPQRGRGCTPLPAQHHAAAAAGELDGEPVTATFAAAQVLDTAPWRSLRGSGVQLLDIDGDGQAADLAVLTGTSPGFARRVGRQWLAPGTFDTLPTDVLADPECAGSTSTATGGPTSSAATATRSPGSPRRASAASCPADGSPLSPTRPTGCPPCAPTARAGGARRRHDRRRPGRPRAGAQRRGVLLAEPRLRPVRREGDDVGAPQFDVAERSTARGLLAADVDGSGTTDLVYAGATGVSLHLNESGNAWARRSRSSQLPRVDAPGDVRVADLLGTGTACMRRRRPVDARSRVPAGCATSI